MRTTMILDEALVDKARKLTGIAGKTAVVHAGLRALIEQRSAARLAALGGTDRRGPQRSPIVIPAISPEGRRTLSKVYIPGT